MQVSYDVPISIEAEAQPAAAAPVGNEAEVPVVEAAGDQDADGTWVDVADEDVTRAKEKGKASANAGLLEKADEQPGPSS